MRYAISCLLILAACSRSETADPDRSASEPAPTADTDSPKSGELGESAQETLPNDSPPAAEPQVDESPPSLELIEVGEAPRRRLQHAYQEGSSHVFRVRSSWKVDAIVFPVGGLTVMPDLDYRFEVVVKSVAANGAAECELKVLDVTLKPSEEVGAQLMASVKRAAAAMKGLRGHFRVDARGIVGPLELLDIPTNASPRFYEMGEQIQRALQLASLPLPPESVGVGATWVVSEPVQHRNARIRQRSTYELLDIDGRRVRAKATVEQTAAVPQHFRPPASQLNLRLVEHRFQGDGTGTWELGTLAPRSATEETTTALIAERRGAKPQFVIIATELKLKLEKAR